MSFNTGSLYKKFTCFRHFSLVFRLVLCICSISHCCRYSKGMNRRTGRTGLFPSYKVRENIDIVKFPTYPEVPISIPNRRWRHDPEVPISNNNPSTFNAVHTLCLRLWHRFSLSQWSIHTPFFSCIVTQTHMQKWVKSYLGGSVFYIVWTLS